MIHCHHALDPGQSRVLFRDIPFAGKTTRSVDFILDLNDFLMALWGQRFGCEINNFSDKSSTGWPIEACPSSWPPRIAGIDLKQSLLSRCRLRSKYRVARHAIRLEPCIPMHRATATTSSLIRRALIVLVVAVIATASVVGSMASVSTSPPSRHSVAGWSGAHEQQQRVPTPCRKVVLPGGMTVCPLTAFNLNGVAADGAAAGWPRPPGYRLYWHLANLRLTAQCGVSSPYRPPPRVA